MQTQTKHVENMHIHQAIATAPIQDQMNEEMIQTWLVEQIARITGLMMHEVDVAQPFSFYGIDSVAAAGLSGELSNWLHIRLAPTITWDYPTIGLLTRYLVQFHSSKQLMVV
jgi:acyl carrier protein